MKFISYLSLVFICFSACNIKQDVNTCNSKELDSIVSHIYKYNIIEKYKGYWIQPWAPRFRVPLKEYNIIFYKSPEASANNALKVTDYDSANPAKLKYYNKTEDLSKDEQLMLDSIYNRITELRSLNINAIKSNKGLIEIYINYCDSTYSELHEVDSNYNDYFLKLNIDKVEEYSNIDYKYVLVVMDKIINKKDRLDSLSRWYSSIREIDTNLYYYRSYLF